MAMPGTVPTAPPQNVQAEAVNSTTIRFLWNPPPQQFINGINQGYKVRPRPGLAREALASGSARRPLPLLGSRGSPRSCYQLCCSEVGLAFRRGCQTALCPLRKASHVTIPAGGSPTSGVGIGFAGTTSSWEGPCPGSAAPGH